MPKDSKHTKAGFSPILTNLLCLRVTQMPISPDLAILGGDDDDRQTDGHDCFTPCTCARGKKHTNLILCFSDSASLFLADFKKKKKKILIEM